MSDHSDTNSGRISANPLLIRHEIIIYDMTQNELLNLALPKYKEIENITYDDFNIENTYKSMLKYNSKKALFILLC